MIVVKNTWGQCLGHLKIPAIPLVKGSQETIEYPKLHMHWLERKILLGEAKVGVWAEKVGVWAGKVHTFFWAASFFDFSSCFFFFFSSIKWFSPCVSSFSQLQKKKIQNILFDQESKTAALHRVRTENFKQTQWDTCKKKKNPWNSLKPSWGKLQGKAKDYSL